MQRLSLLWKMPDSLWKVRFWHKVDMLIGLTNVRFWGQSGQWPTVANATDEVIEVVGHIPAAILATWGMTEGEVRLILPGKPISGWPSPETDEASLNCVCAVDGARAVYAMHVGDLCPAATSDFIGVVPTGDCRSAEAPASLSGVRYVPEGDIGHLAQVIWAPSIKGLLVAISLKRSFAG